MEDLNIQTEEVIITVETNIQTTVEEKMVEPVVCLKHVDIFQQKILILSDVSFSVNKGEFVYIVGKTGSGKSNLLKLMYGDVQAATGEVNVVGYDMNKISTKNIQRLRRKLGIVFQDYQLLQDRSVYENLKFITKVTGWKDRHLRDERIMEVLEMVGLKTKGHKMPHQLSGGEQQRVCIARALINKPELILADEPTGNLDPESSYDIFYLLKQIAEEGTSVLIATHDFLIINQIPSRVLQISDGKVIE
jgi:cell division transport system ATP-binding protein